MKSKISKILGVGLTVAMLVSLLVVAAPGTPASAATQSWGSETSALNTGDVYGHKLSASGLDIYDLALAGNGTTIYAATGSVGAKLYRSLDNGATWAGLTVPADASSIYKVALAPDVADGSVLAIIADDVEVYYSLDGTTTWYNLGTIADTTAGTEAAWLSCLAFSRTVGVTRTLAVGGMNTSDGAGLWYMDFGVLPAPWVDATSNIDVWDVSETHGYYYDGQAVFALAFSPTNFAGDRALAVVTGPYWDDATNTDVAVQVANFFTKNWNGDITGYTGWGTGLVVESLASGNVTEAASLALDPNFLGQVDTSRLIYVGLSTDEPTTLGTLGGVYRYTNTTKYQLLADTTIHSVALNAAGDKLVAGGCDDNAVYRVASPATAVSTSVLASPAFKRPSGQAYAYSVVALWMGTSVAVGTSGDQSAFSVSTDDGKCFNDISLVDATIAPKDFAVSTDGTLIYLVSTSGGYTSLWSKGSTAVWVRVLVLDDTSDYIVRAAPENFAVAYLAQRASPYSIYYTNDGGNTTWLPRYSPGIIQDMAVESASIVYLLHGTTVSKSIDSGLIWNGGLAGTTIKAGFTGYNISLISAGNLLVGATSTTGMAGGVVAYSTDGNVSWTVILAGAVPPSAGNVVATADKLSSGGWIFIMTSSASSNIYRWNVGVSTTWSSMKATAPGYGWGIAVSQGVLYAITGSDAKVMWRCLTPTTVASPSTSAATASTEWSEVSYYPPGLNDTPQSLWVSPVGKLWGIGAYALAPTTPYLWSFSDALVNSAPTLVAPATGSVMPVNVAQGMTYTINFQFKPPTYYPYIRYYQIQISTDNTFVDPLLNIVTGEDTTFSSTVTLQIGVYGYDYYFEFLPDTTYYWRIRTAPTYYWNTSTPKAGTVDSPWTTAFSFKTAGQQVATINSPARGATDVSTTPTYTWSETKGAVLYELEVSTDPNFDTTVLSVTSDKAFYQTSEDEALEYNTTYYWRVRVPGGDWIYGVFTTMAEPTTPAPPITFAPTVTTTQTIPGPEVPIIPTYILWIIIAIGGVLLIALIVLIVRTRAHGA